VRKKAGKKKQGKKVNWRGVKKGKGHGDRSTIHGHERKPLTLDSGRPHSGLKQEETEHKSTRVRTHHGRIWCVKQVSGAIENGNHLCG
jgi:hypothetical protein